MPINASEKKYLQTVLDSLGEITIQYNNCQDENEKKQIKEKYNELTQAYKNRVDDLLTRDLDVDDQTITAIEDIGAQISKAATTQQILTAVAKLAAKLIAPI